MSLQAIIFDIGNVILRFDFQCAMRKLRSDGEPAAQAILDLIEPIKALYEAGRIDRADFQRQVREVLAFTRTDAEFVTAWEDIFTENKPMIDLIEHLEGKMPLYLLSNTSDIHKDFIFRQYPVFSRFTDGVYSYSARASKPDGEIYEIAARQFNCRRSETLFIDDLEANIVAAKNAGFQAHHYHYDRHSDLLTTLKENGIDVPV